MGSAFGQAPPPVAMRPADLRRDLIEHATIVVKPGERIEDGAILLENGWITAVGKAGEVKAPAGTTVHDARGKTIYPGLIDAGLVVDSAAVARAVRAQFHAGSRRRAKAAKTEHDGGVVGLPLPVPSPLPGEGELRAKRYRRREATSTAAGGQAAWNLHHSLYMGVVHWGAPCRACARVAVLV